MPEVLTQLVERQIHRWSRIDAVLKKGQASAAAVTAPTRRPVITVSREAGSGGRVVAKALSEQLGMDLFGFSIVDAIAESAQCERDVIDSLDETARSDLENWIAGLLHNRSISNQEYAIHLARAITSIASHGLAVVLGRGGSFVLGERADLRLRFRAPFEFRVRNMIEYEKLSEEESRAKLTELDERRRSFIERIFDADIAEPSHYDLVIDTSRVRPVDCVDLALHAFRMRLPPSERAALHIDGVDE
jgi:cytidylate kinase